MKTTLGHIATIQTGLFAKPVKEGNLAYLQARHFNENGILSQALHLDIIFDKSMEKHLLIPGDILFAAKGNRNFAAEYKGGNSQAVASTSFFVLRIQKSFQQKVIPEFLVWKINQPDSQNYLKANAIGTSMVSISKAVLSELEISIPTLKIQKAILKIVHLRNKEKELKSKIELLREKQIQQSLIQVINYKL